MSSIRRLKKDINFVTMELISECLAYRNFHSAEDAIKVDKVIESIVEERNGLVERINKGSKTSSKELRKHFNNIIADSTNLVKKLDQLGQ